MADAIDPNAGTGDAPANDEANAAKQELAEMKAKFEKLEKQAQGQSAMLRKVNETLEALAKKKDEPPADEKPKGPMAAKLAEIDAIKKDLAEERGRTQEKLARARMTALMRSVEGQISASGVKPGLAKMASEMVAARIKDRLTFDDSTGEDVAIIKDGDELTTVHEYVSRYLDSDEGKDLLPEKDKPNLSGLLGKGSARMPGSKVRVSQADLLSGRFSMEDVIAGKVVLSGG